MSPNPRCRCQSCTIRGLTWPVLFITAGVLFLLSQIMGGRFSFGNTWPVLLLVIGLVQLASSTASKEGHVEDVPPAPASAPPTIPPTNPPQISSGGQGQ
jgi:Domain of unknown function (DUF5668)